MGKIHLQSETLAYCSETTFGQLPTSPSGTRLSLLSENLKVGTENKVFQQGLLSFYHGQVVRHVKAAGEVQTYLYPNFYHDLIKAAMRGAVATSGSGPYTHTITLAGKEYSYTFERAVTDMDKYLRYYGCRIGAARIAFPTVGPITVTFAILGLREQLFDAPFDETLDEVSEEPYLAEDSLLYVESEAQAGFISGNVELAVAMKVGRFSPRDQRAREIWPSVVAANGAVTIYAEDVARLGWEVSKTLRNIEFWLANGSNAFRVRFEAARIINISPPFVSVGNYAQTVEFQGAKEEDALPVELIITNSQGTI